MNVFTITFDQFNEPCLIKVLINTNLTLELYNYMVMYFFVNLPYITYLTYWITLLTESRQVDRSIITLLTLLTN